MEKSNKIVHIAVTFVVAAGIFFYFGMKYGQSTASVGMPGRGGNGNFAQGGGGFGGVRGGQRGGGANGGGVVAGEILSMDDVSITVKMRDGGSKIIFFSGSTQVMKTDAGSSKDLKVGEQVSANGMANPDGSVTAQSIQIRPLMRANEVGTSTQTK